MSTLRIILVIVHIIGAIMSISVLPKVKKGSKDINIDEYVELFHENSELQVFKKQQLKTMKIIIAFYFVFHLLSAYYIWNQQITIGWILVLLSISVSSFEYFTHKKRIDSANNKIEALKIQKKDFYTIFTGLILNGLWIGLLL